MIDAAAAVVAAQHLQTIRYVQFASSALMITEWISLLPEEIDLVWKTKWNATKLLYLFTRYSTFIDMPLNVIYYIKPVISQHECTWNYWTSTWMTLFGMACTELILVVRTWAIYGQSRKIFIFLGVVWVVLVGANIPIVYLFLRSIQFDEPPAVGVPGCFMTGASSIVFATYASLLVGEILIVVMTVKQAIVHLKRTRSRSRLLYVLYRDGILFFVALLSLTSGNVILLLTAPPGLLSLLMAFTRIVHSVLCCRVMLNIRGAGRQMELGARSRIQDLRSPHGNPLPEFRTSESESGRVQLDTVELMDGILPEVRTVDLLEEAGRWRRTEGSAGEVWEMAQHVEEEDRGKDGLGGLTRTGTRNEV